MINKRIFIALLAVIFFIPIFSIETHAMDNMTFSQAIDRLYGSNEAIEAAKAMAESLNFEKKAAIGLFFPKVYINAAYAAFDKDLSIEVDLKGTFGGLAPLFPPALGGVLGNIPNLNQVIQQKSFFTLDATAMWTIFTGGKILAANRAAKLKMDKANVNINSVKEELGSTLAERYFSLRLATDVMSLRKEVLATMKIHYEKALKMEKAGVLAKVERLHAAVSMQDAQRTYNASVRDAQLAMAALKSIINVEAEINPDTPLFIISAESLEPLIFFQEQALGGNAKLLEIDIVKNLTGVATQSEMSNYYPKIFLFGNAHAYDWQLSPIMPDFTFGVGFSFNIFEGLSGYHKVQAAKAVEKSVFLKQTRAKKDINTLVEQQYMTLQNARADYEAVQASIDFTKEYVRARLKAFETGLATSLDVVDAELAFSKAKLESVMAAYKFDTALAKLLETAGMFHEFEGYRQKASIELVFENK